MKPVCGSGKPAKFKLNKEKGQLSVFLGISMTIIVTLLAFIINVGLFVKAKINLQNATDAAAWSGAAVQSRQLTNIAYLNWEMRNNYKEWMFKSYVLGQLALSTVKDTGITANNGSSNNMQFRAKPFEAGTSKPDEYEKFNLPSICIHFGSTHNICDLVRLPGLPRFNTVGLPSISAHHESVLTALVTTKAQDCSRRSTVNFGAALLWAYGTGKAGLSFSNMPFIASRRVGAWTKAMELGLRMRNLEAQVNLPPISDGICNQCDGGGTKIQDIDSNFPGNERPIKAYWSAFRSLSGGDMKSQGNSNDEFSQSFKLTELEPNKVEFSGSKTLSNYLIPNTPVQGQGYNANTKYYLDLQATPLNLVSFFTSFISGTGTFDPSGSNTAQEADCGGSKTGMPVPGFIFGFIKNPELMTYYAVKSEAKFVGLFYPFGDTEGITLNAYAAAKPYGGRIGPKLFAIKDNKIVTARTQSSLSRSAAYLSSPNIPASMTTGPLKDRYKNGSPIPLTDNFWVQSDADPIGGTPDSGDVFFSIPNLLYEYDDSTMDSQVNSGKLLNIMEPVNNKLSAKNPVETLGLHSKPQFNALKANFTGSTDTSAVSQESIEDAINMARRPTKYDAVNYLIPVVPDAASANNSENIPFVRAGVNCEPFQPLSKPTACYNLYAPLYGNGTLFPDATATQEVIAETIDRFKPAVEKFINALKEVSESILDQASTGPGAYQEAADTIYQPGLLPSAAPSEPQCQRASLAQNFNHFFNGTSKACDITPIVDLIVEYLDDQPPSFGVYHTAPLSGSYNYPSSSLMTAYMPGPRQGAQDDGSIPKGGPLASGGEVISARRNFYSTKFVPLERLVGGVDGYAKNGQWMMIEESLTNPPQDLTGVIKNQLKKSDLNIWDKLFF